MTKEGEIGDTKENLENVAKSLYDCWARQTPALRRITGTHPSGFATF